MSKLTRITSLTFLAGALLAVPVAAQIAPGRGLERVAALRPVTVPDRPVRPGAESAGNYQAEGAIIGALALGVPTYLFLGGLCETSDCTGEVHLSSLGMVAIGAFLGAVIGSGIERKPDATSAATP